MAKIAPLDIVERWVSGWKKFRLKVVFTNGCFDILHAGHIHLLAEAASFGDKLVVGINSDLSVRKIKGPGRPVNDERSRGMVIASVQVTDALLFFDDETPYEIIKRIQPDVLVKGGDYAENAIVGADLVRSWGGEVRIVKLLDGFSTTGMIGKMKTL
ncbi:MAG: D-glycero-beta-D-manno-heptose 1-phosphate adenylyltransferase [Bacteroidetes bacterium]|nr:D-glycero-beta-D-manno-heptose 1-phosphate adenylyltransferase [Bacteroidota bacterium]